MSIDPGPYSPVMLRVWNPGSSSRTTGTARHPSFKHRPTPLHVLELAPGLAAGRGSALDLSNVQNPGHILVVGGGEGTFNDNEGLDIFFCSAASGKGVFVESTVLLSLHHGPFEAGHASRAVRTRSSIETSGPVFPRREA